MIPSAAQPRPQNADIDLPEPPAPRSTLPRRFSEETVTSPMSGASPDTEAVLMEEGRAAGRRIATLQLAQTPPRFPSERPARIIVRQQTAPQPRPHSRVAPTVREQMVTRRPGPVEVFFFAARASIRVMLWLGVFGGITVATVIGFLRQRQRASAIVNGVLIGAVSVVVTLSALARWMLRVTGFAQGHDFAPAYVNIDALRLHKEIEFWQTALGRPLRHKNWHLDQSEESKLFALFLAKVEVSKSYRDLRTRPQMLARIGALLDEMDASRTLRQEIFGIVQDAFATCGDRVLLGLNNMELAIQNRKAERGELSEADLLKLGRGMFRMERLQRFAFENRLVGRPSQEEGADAPDDVETLLNLQARLSERLELPLPRFEPASGSSELSMIRLWQARRYVEAYDKADFTAALDRYKTGLRVLRHHPERALPIIDAPEQALFLAENYTPWTNHIDRTREAENSRLKQRVGDYQARLDEHFLGPNPDPSAYGGQSYNTLSKRAMFYYNHGLAYERALRALIQANTPPVAVPDPQAPATA